MTKSKETEAKAAQQEQEALGRLKEIFSEHNTVYGIQVHCSRSGMLRRYRFFAIVEYEPIDGADLPTTIIHDIDGLVARGLHYTWHDPDGSIQFGGCGYDPVDNLRDDLSFKLFGDHDSVQGRRL